MKTQFELGAIAGIEAMKRFFQDENEGAIYEGLSNKELDSFEASSLHEVMNDPTAQNRTLRMVVNMYSNPQMDNQHYYKLNYQNVMGQNVGLTIARLGKMSDADVKALQSVLDGLYNNG